MGVLTWKTVAEVIYNCICVYVPYVKKTVSLLINVFWGGSDKFDRVCKTFFFCELPDFAGFDGIWGGAVR